MRKQVRKLRHWKQRFNKNSAFVWRRAILYAGEITQPGEPIPDELQAAPTKLRRFWESSTIELAEFEAPDVQTGQPQVAPVADEPVEIDPPIEGVSVTKGNGSWFIVTTDGDEVKVNGQRALDELIDELRFEADVEDDEDDDQEQLDLDEDTGDTSSDSEVEQSSETDTDKPDDDFLN